MRSATAPRTRSWDPLHHAPTTSTYSSPLQFSLGKWQGFAMEEKGILSQTHNVVAEYWGKGGILKWAEFLCSRASLWNGTPTPYFIGQKIYLFGWVIDYGRSKG
jgi:hypothetical protein